MYTLGDLVRLKNGDESEAVITVTTAETVHAAVRLMIEHNFSQLPVVDAEDGSVVGAISEESIVRSLYHLSNPEAGGTLSNGMGLNVAQCIDEASLHPSNSEMLALGKTLADSPYILVGEDGILSDILTHADIVRLFRELAAHFLLIGNIEQSLRLLIGKVFDTDETIETAIGHAFYYRKEHKPQSLDEMTIDDYRQLIMNKKNWPHFAGLLFDRQATQNRLLKLRDLRNDLFHFRLHMLNSEQKDFLQSTVRWLEQLVHVQETHTSSDIKEIR
ncbi:CBS domain-containing protein [Candidatus Bipolaricaulota bacterium]|nr:CBS domain-containing protein [Candidatus Bipolaricaulota bacterium]